jgi:hypothetical protein
MKSTSLNSRLVMTLGLAIPAIFTFGGSAQAAQPSSTVGTSTSPVARPIAKPQQVNVNQLNLASCPACRSGLDTRFSDRTNPTVNPVVNQPVVKPTVSR